MDKALYTAKDREMRMSAEIREEQGIQPSPSVNVKRLVCMPYFENISCCLKGWTPLKRIQGFTRTGCVALAILMMCFAVLFLHSLLIVNITESSSSFFFFLSCTERQDEPKLQLWGLKVSWTKMLLYKFHFRRPLYAFAERSVKLVNCCCHRGWFWFVENVGFVLQERNGTQQM